MISTIPFFKDVNPQLLDALNLKRKRYHKGATVHQQGTPCPGLDIVLTGSLAAYALSQNGTETVVFNFHKDSIIGANLLFGTANRYPMTIYCTADCELLQVPIADVEILLRDYAFTLNFVKNISLNSQGMNKKILMNMEKNLRENLIDYFESLALAQSSATIQLPLTKKQLADYFSVQRPSLFRELKKMKDEGLIAIDNRSIRLLYDFKRL